jgi:transcriptional regulator with XRE-family HTH domain
MSKRNAFIIETKESEALKALRLKSGLSIRKLSIVMDYSHTRIHQMEQGRENISDEYVSMFINALGESWSTWSKYLGEKDEFFDIRQKCHETLESLDPKKLEIVYGLLTNF